MLKGIRTGKRKRPAVSSVDRTVPTAPREAGCGAGSAEGNGMGGGSAGGGGNRSAADALRASLLGSGGGGGGARKGGTSDVHSRLDARASSYKNDGSNVRDLQGRGRISEQSVASESKGGETIVINSGNAADSRRNIEYEHEQKVRFNSRGKLSRHAHDQLRQRTDHDMTIEEMAAEERKHSSSGMDETYARNVMRMGKGFKKLEKQMGMNSRSGADEEDYLQETTSLSNMYRSNDDKYSPAELASRNRSRQIAQHDAISRWKAKSWWWMESPKFEKRYLIALGNRVSLVMAPTHRRLHQDSGEGSWDGGQCYIVPLSHAESFVGIDEDAWAEVRRFQSSLRRMFEAEGRGVVFLETVPRASRDGGAGLQARMDVVPMPLSAERDAPLYFRSALAEVAQEWGTHGSKPIVLNGKKSLRSAVPRGFPYFYCGWEGGGFVQIIDNEDDGDDDGGGIRSGGGSKRFPKDFGIDTIGGIMGCDPIRFQRKTPSRDGDKGEILKFCEKWKQFDWTLELDG